jgi:hypothetical protein
MGHDLPLQGFLHLSQFLLTLAKVQREPGRYALGLPLLDLLPLEITLEGVDPLLRTIALSPCPIALRAKPLGHLGILTGICLHVVIFS